MFAFTYQLTDIPTQKVQLKLKTYYIKVCKCLCKSEYKSLIRFATSILY